MDTNVLPFVDEEIREKARKAVAEGRLLDLKNDIVFKSFFSKDTPEGIYCRTRMLSSIIGQEVKEATVLNPDILPDFVLGKFPRLDIHCVLDDGSEIDVEMQGTRQHDDQIARSVFYAASLAKNSVKKGMSYMQMPRVHQIMFMDFTATKDDEFYHSYSLRDDKTFTLLSNLLQIHFIELPKLKMSKSVSELEFWAMMVKSGGSETTLKELGKIDKLKEDYTMATALLNTISSSQQEWERKFAFESAEMDRISAIEYATRQGIAQGITQGIAQGAHENAISNAINFLRMGLSPEQVAQGTHPPLSEVNKLQLSFTHN